MKVVFRVDASARMGSGHLMRCMTLAEALRERGAQLQFICREHAGNLIALLQQKAFPVTVLPAPVINDTVSGEGYTAWLGATEAEDAEQTIKALDGEMPDWLVVDHYGIDMGWEKRLRPHAVKLLVIDDLANRHHDCDILLDQNYSEESEQRYASFVPPLCKVLLGPRFALLRKEFKVIRERLEPRAHNLKKILVFFTAGDDQGETLKAMQGIELFGKAEYVDVVVGRSNPENSEIRQKCDECHWGYHCQIDYMPKLIAQADLVIGAGGSSNWERCALGVPALVVILAENQAPIAQALGRASVVYNLGWGRDLQAVDYANVLTTLNHDCLAAMSEKALALVDAKGAERMADELLAA
ncbi:MAG: UDP-2,4-diacetamido-2,4,6-trideoxy-beta-L-altropyranose hydrolase [Rhodoferax sp.]|nr:UDP-2,4-diacetamido-2,4,6-trideoxy-beta-L-altropyranose hydrolase [Rhodoferax sp.]